MDQELADAATYAPGRRCMCTHQTAALFCAKLRYGHKSVSVYLNNPARFHPDPI